MSDRRQLRRCAVVRNRPVARDTVVIDFEWGDRQRFEAGQFVMVHPLRAGCLLPRPFSILDQSDATLSILVKVVGKGSAALAALQAGEELRAFGPLGSSFDAPALRERPAILVAGGVGLVPLHVLARELRREGTVIPLFGAQTPADLPRELFQGDDSNWQLWVEREVDTNCREGLVTTGLREALQEHPAAVVATCGPTPMMRAVAAICRDAGHPLWLCLEEQMGCGAGVCRACVIGDAHSDRMRTVCKEGPVFALDDIRFELEAVSS